MELERIDSLNVADTTVPTLTPAERCVGTFVSTVGGVLSGVTLVFMSSWISAAVSARP